MKIRLRKNNSIPERDIWHLQRSTLLKLTDEMTPTVVIRKYALMMTLNSMLSIRSASKARKTEIVKQLNKLGRMDGANLTLYNLRREAVRANIPMTNPPTFGETESGEEKDRDHNKEKKKLSGHRLRKHHQ